MSMYWIIFIGFALLSWLVSSRLQNKFEKIFQDSYAEWHDRERRGRKDVA
mgnify:CR=1 FL=1